MSILVVRKIRNHFAEELNKKVEKTNAQYHIEGKTLPNCIAFEGVENLT